jgi:hypothetical protein
MRSSKSVSCNKESYHNLIPKNPFDLYKKKMRFDYNMLITLPIASLLATAGWILLWVLGGWWIARRTFTLSTNGEFH